MKGYIFLKVDNAIKTFFILSLIISFSSLKAQNSNAFKTIPEALIELASQHNKDISFPNSYFDQKLRRFDFTNKSLKDALSQILKDSNIKFLITDTDIRLEKYITRYGYIVDAISSEKLIAAHIFDTSKKNVTYSNTFGFFSIDLPESIQNLKVSYIGYKTKTFKLSEQVNIIELETDNQLNHILISDSEDKSLKSIAYDGTELLRHDLEGISAAGGEADLFQFLYTQPGVQSGPDGFGGLHIRGGNSDQNLITLDGVQIYNPAHSFGLFSIFTNEIINSTQFKKNAFTSDNFGRTSSTLKIRTKEGNLNSWSGSLNQSTVATNVFLSGPMIKNKLAVSLSGRKSIFDSVVRSRSRENKINKAESGFSNHGFYDLNAKLKWQINKKDKLVLSLYRGNDNYSDETRFNIVNNDLNYSDISNFEADWSNTTYALNWNKLYGPKLFSNLILSLSEYNYQSLGSYSYDILDFYFNESEIHDYNSDFFVGVKDYTFRYDFDFFPTNEQHYKFGLALSEKRLRPGVNDYSFSSQISNLIGSQIYLLEAFDDFIDNRYNVNDLTFYLNHENKISNKDHINIGANLNRFGSSNQLFEESAEYWLYQLNLSYSRLLSDKNAISLSLDRMYQTMHLLTTSDIGFPNDVWVPSNEFIEPQISRQINLGYQCNNKKSLILKSNLYYKVNDKVLRYTFSENIPSLTEIATQIWEEEVTPVKTYSRGIELSAEYASNKAKINVSYTLSKSDRLFDTIPEAKRYDFEFDQRHRLNILYNQKFSNKIGFYINFNFASGLAQTIYSTLSPVDNLQFLLPYSEGSSSINDFRLPNYHRIDVGLNLSLKHDQIFHKLVIGVQNVLNTKNAIYAYNLIQGIGNLGPGINYNNALPILPQINYLVTFGANR